MYDIIIIGGGAAGMSAAIYAVRGGMKTLVLEKVSHGGQAAKTYEIDNYPGFFDSPSGPELMDKFHTHATKLGAEIKTEAVRDIENISENIKLVKTRRNTYETRTVIFATGATPKKLNIPGEAELTGLGVSYCATCDGAFFKGLDTVVIGGGNTAAEDALYLARFCDHVFLLNRSENMRASAVLADKVFTNPKITVYKNMSPESFEGDTKLERVIAKNSKTGERGFINASGAIVAIGISPENTLAKKCGVDLCEQGFIKTDSGLSTNIDGVYAAGDCRVSPLRQVITAAADGAIAATSAISFILKNRR